MEPKDRPVYGKGEKARLLIPLREDIPLFLRWINDPEVNQFLFARGPMYEKMEIEFFESITSRAATTRFFVIGTEALVPIGTVGLHGIDWTSRVATLGISIGEKEYWGKGYGTDAVECMLKMAFREMNLNKVELDVHAFNERAQRCYIRCGFTEEGRMRQHVFKNGEYHDTLTMGVLAPDWFKLHAST